MAKYDPFRHCFIWLLIFKSHLLSSILKLVNIINVVIIIKKKKIVLKDNLENMTFLGCS